MTSFTTPSSSFWEQLYTVVAPSHPALQRPTWPEQASPDQEQASPQGDVVHPGSVTLTYRGRSYQSSTYWMTGVETKVKTIYRGASHQLNTFCACRTSDRPQRTLYYRGVPYVQ